MYSDNQVDIYIVINHVFRERTKYIEMNSHFVRDALSQKLISNIFTPNLANMFIKHVSLKVFSCLYNKLDMIDMYALAWKGVLNFFIT